MNKTLDKGRGVRVIMPVIAFIMLTPWIEVMVPIIGLLVLVKILEGFNRNE